ncbi:MAG: sigma-54 dependent transcriptional regulator [Muribaculaceae bacterium]|nr:sigma-54 dependent transcriptional regulator [Muribaculaceae bacterium]
MILIVDDDRSVRSSIGLVLRRAGYDTESAATPDEALEIMRRQTPQLIIMDMNFSRTTTGEEGLHLLRQSRILLPDVPVILLTAWGSIQLAVEGMKAGAFDFMTKPWNNHVLLQQVATALSLGTNNKESEEANTGFDRNGIIGSSGTLRTVLDMAERVAPTDAPVLILGENGTGKELIAQAIHRNSRRAAGPLVTVNIGGVPAPLFESEMFGYAKGAFTGAVSDRRGRFEEADKGTIFLDEIGDLDQTSQVKLLRVLQQHTFERLGENLTRKVDLRVVCATNADLPALVAAGKWREDLFYRINLVTLRLPPLRERREDIAPLVYHFLREAALRDGQPVPEISAEALRLLEKLPYPGNIRELRNIIESAYILGRGTRIEVSALSGVADRAEIPVSGRTLADMERQAITDALARYGGNLSKVALVLGITRQALYRRMEKFGIVP